MLCCKVGSSVACFSKEMTKAALFRTFQFWAPGCPKRKTWANSYLRMYLRWGRRQSFNVELMEVSAGGCGRLLKLRTIRFEATTLLVGTY